MEVTELTIKVFVEFQAKPGKRDEMIRFIQHIIDEHGPHMEGYLGSAQYVSTDDPDMLYEIADWTSVEARDAHMQKAAATGMFEPFGALLAGPFRVTIMSPLG